MVRVLFFYQRHGIKAPSRKAGLQSPWVQWSIAPSRTKGQARDAGRLVSRNRPNRHCVGLLPSRARNEGFLAGHPPHGQLDFPRLPASWGASSWPAGAGSSKPGDQVPGPAEAGMAQAWGPGASYKSGQRWEQPRHLWLHLLGECSGCFSGPLQPPQPRLQSGLSVGQTL